MDDTNRIGHGEVVKSLRLGTELSQAAERHARERGLTFSDLVEAGLRQQIGWPTNPMFDLVEAINADLSKRFPTRRGFPPDVTLGVFRRVQADKTMRKLYEAAITAPEGSVSVAAKDNVHRRLGKTVKAVLNARVIGRSPELASDELIKTHALLAPAGRTATGRPR